MYQHTLLKWELNYKAHSDVVVNIKNQNQLIMLQLSPWRNQKAFFQIIYTSV